MNKRLHYSYPDANMHEGRVIMYTNGERFSDVGYTDYYHVFKDPECTIEVTPDELNDAIHAGLFIRIISDGFTEDIGITKSSYGFKTNDDGSLELICAGDGFVESSNEINVMSKKHIEKEG